MIGHVIHVSGRIDSGSAIPVPNLLDRDDEPQNSCKSARSLWIGWRGEMGNTDERIVQSLTILLTGAIQFSIRESFSYPLRPVRPRLSLRLVVGRNVFIGSFRLQSVHVWDLCLICPAQLPDVPWPNRARDALPQHRQSRQVSQLFFARTILPSSISLRMEAATLSSLVVIMAPDSVVIFRLDQR